MVVVSRFDEVRLRKLLLPVARALQGLLPRLTRRLPTLHISVTDSATVRDSPAMRLVHAAVAGVANLMHQMTVAVEQHQHDVPH
jgi:hypothetical protein